MCTLEVLGGGGRLRRDEGDRGPCGWSLVTEGTVWAGLWGLDPISSWAEVTPPCLYFTGLPGFPVDRGRGAQRAGPDWRPRGSSVTEARMSAPL